MPTLRTTMTIDHFELRDHTRGWSLEGVDFAAFNLLVGLSGAGKTRILRSLHAVCAIARGRNPALRSCEWQLTVRAEGIKFEWSATLKERVKSADEEPEAHFLKEKIVADGEVIVQRTENSVEFKGTPLPQIKDTESCISIFNRENAIAPLYNSLGMVKLSEAPGGQPSHRYQIWPDEAKVENLAELRNNNKLTIVQKAYLLRRDFPTEFDCVVDEYRAIFGTVSKVLVDTVAKIDPDLASRSPFSSIGKVMLTLAIVEDGVERPTCPSDMSSGMLRTLIHLFELALWPEGTVVIVDEYENSLGLNCLPALTACLMRRAGDMQFILTSHHPYVIENIPMESWRVVTRDGSEVKVAPASAIPGISTRSKQSGFDRLMSSPAFEVG